MLFVKNIGKILSGKFVHSCLRIQTCAWVKQAPGWNGENCSGRAGMKELVLFIIAKKKSGMWYDCFLEIHQRAKHHERRKICELTASTGNGRSVGRWIDV